jgi:hypothetical protein
MARVLAPVRLDKRPFHGHTRARKKNQNREPFHDHPLCRLRRGTSGHDRADGIGAVSAETLRWARAAEALTLDPHSQNEGPTTTLMHQIYEPLILRNMEGADGRRAGHVLGAVGR